jgi:hypothetical protein
MVSLAIYGVYGLQHSAWRNKIAACSAAVALGAPPPARKRSTRPARPRDSGPKMSAIVPPELPDEFEERVGKVLGPGKLAVAAQLLNLRAQFQTAAAANAHTMVAQTANELNARNQRFLDAAARLLAKSEFSAIFGVEPGETVNLVLPDPSK